MVKTGLEELLNNHIKKIKGYRIGLVVNPSSVDSKLNHAINLFLDNKDVHLATLFGPQHGIRGETQDNMIEWEGFTDKETDLPVFSLYGKTRKPTKKMLKDVDILIFDIQDIGAKYYTFIYTMSYVMQGAKKCNKKVIILDRPNPITGNILEGFITKENLKSFVGLHPIIIRHGMTIGELALLFNKEFKINCDLDVIKMSGWKRNTWFDETGLPWIMPSPNIPILNSAIVYPGMCLLEGTNLSEGRGTTRPFEIFGAPFIDPYKLYKVLAEQKLEGVIFRPLYFQPTFQKWYGKLCGGLQIHIVDRNKYKSLKTAIAILSAVFSLYPKNFEYRKPPYEYEYKKLPFDILVGNNILRNLIEKGASLESIESLMDKEVTKFNQIRERYLLY
jgi:uncharacterized protein YbbC (DUF1343 family)